MTKEAAIHQFFSQFGIPAYSSTTIIPDLIFKDPENFEAAYLTHDFPTSAFEEGEVSGTVQLRYYTESEAAPNAKAQEIANAIGMGGVFLDCDEGCIWLKRGSPFKINVPQEQGTEMARYLKTKQLNITAEYLTFN